MLNWEQIVISALVGAAIGYVTNWIAIKMLFRPLKPLRIWGFRLPFTPGVIPKEKKRLATSIGEAVSKHLLTREFISGQLLSPAAEEKVRSFIRERMTRTAEKTVLEVLDGAGVDSRLRETCLDQIYRGLLHMTGNRRLQDFLAGWLAEKTMGILDRYPSELVNTGEFQSFKKSLEKAVSRFLSDNENKERFKQFGVEKVDGLSKSTLKIGDLMPEPLREGIREYARIQSQRIVKVVDEYLKSPETGRLLVKRVEDFFNKSTWRRLIGSIFGHLGGDAGKVADKIVEEVTGFFTDRENCNLLARKMESLVDDVLDQRLCDLASRVDAETRKNALAKLSDWLSDRLCTGEMPGLILSGAEKALAGCGMTWGELLEIKDREKTRQEIRDYYRELITRFTSGSEFEPALKDFTGNLAQWFFRSRITDLYPGLKGEGTGLEEKLLGCYRAFVHRYLENVIDFMDFRRLVARRVDELDLLQVEDLVLGIMRRELVAITWFGAILGAGIGVSMAIMQLFF